MSAKAIREATGKRILNKALSDQPYFAQCKFASVDSDNSLDKAESENPWLANTPLVVKPDQLIKRRGKLGLIKVKADLPTVKSWIDERINKDIQVCVSASYLQSSVCAILLRKKANLLHHLFFSFMFQN